jgi:hypothetical protein
MVTTAVGCAVLLVAACGTEGGAAGDGDALCAGVEQLDGVYDEMEGILPPHIEGCEWGERYGGEGAYVRLDLWNPPIPEVLEMWDRRDPIAGRTAYVEGSVSERACRVAVDNGEYLVTVDLYTTPGREVSACDLAEGLVATAASSLG